METMMATRLLEALSNDEFDPSQYRDAYNDAVKAAVAAKIAGQEVVVPKDEATANVLDILDALKMSLEAAKKNKKPAKKGKKP
jgi:DNA end-binding protein Ku